MERNFRNYLIWEEPDGQTLEVIPQQDAFNQEEVVELFETEITNLLRRDSEAFLLNAPVQISCETSGGDVTIYLQISGASPYILSREGNVIKDNLSAEDFPYTDKNPNTGNQEQEICYQIESSEGNTHEVCCIVQP